MRNIIIQAAAILLLSSIAHAQARVIITEIMYNPASTEKQNEAEWIEVANVGNESIEIKDWSVRVNGKRQGWGTFGCTLAPGGVAVLINANAVNEEQFRAAWDAPADSAASETATHTYQIIPMKWGALANNPSPDNPLQILNDQKEIVCEAKRNESWPVVKGAGGPSIYLADHTTTDFTDGSKWMISELGKNGARINAVTALFDKQDTGSPGYVHGLSPAIAAPAQPATPDAPVKTPPTASDTPKPDDSIDY